jgi:hypothetical protein
MAANRKVNNTTTRSPSWQPIEKLITLPHDRHHGGPCGSVINFSFGRHHGDPLLVLSTFILAAMMAIVW